MAPGERQQDQQAQAAEWQPVNRDTSEDGSWGEEEVWIEKKEKSCELGTSQKTRQECRTDWEQMITPNRLDGRLLLLQGSSPAGRKNRLEEEQVAVEMNFDIPIPLEA